MTLNPRHSYILDKLAHRGSVRIDDLASALSVSPMTVHRDLDQLERAGRLRKVRGGAVPAEAPAVADDRCLVCYGSVNPRTQVVLHMADGTQRRACCPHCALMALGRRPQTITSVLVTDFLLGRSVNVRTATFLATPAIAICCSPTVLAFEDVQLARRFQAGFGGELLDLDAALAYVQTTMHLMHS